jgi:hypothetical protein
MRVMSVSHARRRFLGLQFAIKLRIKGFFFADIGITYFDLI